MFPFFWPILIVSAVATFAALTLWAAIYGAAALDRRDRRRDDADEFTPSMHRFGYVQDARNRGDL